MDLADINRRYIKAKWAKGLFLGDIEWLVWECNRLTTDNAALTAENTRIFAMVDAREQTIAELTALCDGYRGEVTKLEARCTTLEEESEGRYFALAKVCQEKANLLIALTRARAEGVEEAIKAAEEVVTTVSVYPTAEQALGASWAKTLIIGAIRERAAKGEQ